MFLDVCGALRVGAIWTQTARRWNAGPSKPDPRIDRKEMVVPESMGLYLAAILHLLLLRNAQGPPHMWAYTVKLAYSYGVAIPVIAALLEITPHQARNLLLRPAADPHRRA